MERQGQESAALEIYLDLQSQNANHQPSYFAASRLLRKTQEWGTLLALIETNLSKGGRNREKLFDKGSVLWLSGRQAQARQLWAEMALRFNHSLNFYSRLSATQISAGALDAAIESLQGARVRLGDSTALAMELAEIWHLKKAYVAACDAYVLALQKSPARKSLITRRFIEMAGDKDGFSAVESVLGETFIMAESPQQAWVWRVLLAEVLLSVGQFEAVTRLLLDDPGETPDIPALLRLSRKLEGERAFSQSGEMYAWISREAGDDGSRRQGLLGLGRSLEESTRRSEPWPRLGGFFPNNSFLQPNIVFLQDAQGGLIRALALYDSLHTLLPNSTEGAMALFRVAEIRLSMTGDFSGAEALYRSLYSSHRLRQASASRLVDALLAQGRLDAAQRAVPLIVAAYDGDVDAPAVLSAQVRIALFKGDTPELKTALKNLQASSGPEADIYNDCLELLAFIESGSRGNEAALNAFFMAWRHVTTHRLNEALAALSALSAQGGALAHHAAAAAINLDLLLQNYAEALARSQSFLVAFPESPWQGQALIWLSELSAHWLLDDAAAAQHYEALLITQPNHLYAEEVRKRLRRILEPS